MNTHTHTHSVFLALLAAFGAARAQSGDAALQRVQISGQRPAEIARADVHAGCPDIVNSLQDALGGTVLRERAAGTTRLQFRVKDNGTTQVSASGGPIAYRLPLRRAVAMLDCARHEDGQLFSVMVRFTPEGEAGGQGNTGTHTVALLAP